MTDYAELKRLAEDAIKGSENWLAAGMLTQLFAANCTPSKVLDLIAENERLAANVKLNLCDYPAIHRGDIDLLISFISGTSQTELAELHQCTPPNISRKIRRVKERLGWKTGMGPLEIHARADQLRALASQGAVVTAGLMAERDQLKAENARLAAACERAEQIINAESKAAAIATGRGNLLQAENKALESSRAKLAGELSRLRAKHKDWSIDSALSKGEQP